MTNYIQTDLKIENDLKEIYRLVKTEYKNVSFDKALPIFRMKMNFLADKYNTTNVEMWKLFFDMISNMKSD